MAQPIEIIAVSVPDAAALLGIGRTHFYFLLRTDPTFPKLLKFGKASRVLVSELRAWAQSQATHPARPALTVIRGVGRA